jgi:hypothetical protein
MNNGLGGDLLTEIDAAEVNDKPFYTEHTTYAPTIVGSTYIF